MQYICKFPRGSMETFAKGRYTSDAASSSENSVGFQDVEHRVTQ